MVSEISHADLQRWISRLSVDGSIRTEGIELLQVSRVIQSHQCISAILEICDAY